MLLPERAQNVHSNKTKAQAHLNIRGPEGEVVAQELHDERAVLVALLAKRVQLADRVIECLHAKLVASPLVYVLRCDMVFWRASQTMNPQSMSILIVRKGMKLSYSVRLA